MKLIKLFVTIALLTITTNSNSQTISPGTDSSYCAKTFIDFTVSIQGNVQDASALATGENDNPTFPQVTPPQIEHINGTSKIHFRVKFWDSYELTGQSFKIRYHFLNSTTSLYTPPYRFLKIKTLAGAVPASISTNPISIDYTKKDTFNINFDYAYYVSSQIGSNAPVPFDSILDYDFRVPEGWRVNGQISSNNWIRGDNTATIISDGSHGNNGAIEIRTVNTCNNTYSPAVQIPVDFKKITLSADRYVCNDSTFVTISNFPNNATSTWRCVDGNYTGLTKINDSTARLLKWANKTIQIYAIVNGPFGIDTTETKSVTFLNRVLYAGANFTSGSTTKILSICNTLSDQFQNGHFRGYLEITDPTITSAKLYHMNDGQSHPAIITEQIKNKKFEIQLHPGNTSENLVLSLSNGCSSKLFYPTFRAPSAILCLDTVLSINSVIENFAISPNPSNGDIHIRNYNKLKVNTVEIYNSMGYQKFKKKYDSKADILHLNINNLGKGIYYILIRTDSIIERKKVSIN